jgi:hypothetical protein
MDLSAKDRIPTWKDELGPAYSLGAGAAAPNMTVLTGSTHVRGLTFGPGDRVDVVVQFNHDVLIGSTSAGVTNFDPHVHYTFVDNPTAGNTVRWKFTYLGAKPSLNGSAEFAPTLSTISSSRHVLTSTEIRKHYLADLVPEISVPNTSYGHSYILWGTLELSTLSTIAAGKVALLAFDIHKPTRTRGTANLTV